MIHKNLAIIKKCLTPLILLYLFACHSNDYQYAVKKSAGIAFSLDDRTIQEWFELRQILNKANFNITFFITQFDSLNQAELDMLQILKQDGHEIGSHGNLHLLSENFIKANSLHEYIQAEIIPSIKTMASKGFTPTSFAYPYGAKYTGTDEELLKYFYALRSVSPLNEEGDITRIDEIYYTQNGDRTISALGIDGDKVNLEMIRAGFKRAKNNQEIILLYGHVPAGESPSQNLYTFDVKLFKAIIDLADSMGLKSYTISELFL